MPGDRFTASSKGLVCSQLALPFAVDEPCTLTWDWSTFTPMQFTVKFTPTRGKALRYTLAEHVGTAWAERGVPVVMAQPVTDAPEAAATPVVIRSLRGDCDRGTAEVEGSGELVLSWSFDGMASSMFGGFFGVSHPDTELQYAQRIATHTPHTSGAATTPHCSTLPTTRTHTRTHARTSRTHTLHTHPVARAFLLLPPTPPLRYEVTVDSTADLRAAAEAELARQATAVRNLQAKTAELLSLAESDGASAEAAAAEVEANRQVLDRILPELTGAEEAFAAQNARVEAELAKLEAMQAPLEELKRAAAAAEAARDAAHQRAVDCGAMRAMHLEELKKYQTGEWEFMGWKGGAEYTK